jgi:hypothetical protein
MNPRNIDTRREMFVDRLLIDLDTQQLKPDVKLMRCMLFSEAPFYYLTAYWA